MRRLFAFTLLTALASAAEPARPPNILFLFADDQRHDTLGAAGHPIVRTPALDRLAADGVRFRNAFVTTSVCWVSRAVVLTGQWARSHVRRDSVPTVRPEALATMFPALLRSSGYRTGHFGKWHLNSMTDGSEPTPGDHGFDEWLFTQNNAVPSHANPTNFIRNGKAVGPLKGFSASLVADEAIRFLEATRGKPQPFFLNVWFHEPHEPVAAAEEFQQRYAGEPDATKREYYGNVSQVDAAIGRILQRLDGLGLGADTFVVFSSDNGPETLRRYKGAERSHGSPGPLHGMKLHVTEAGFRVPGILRWPGKLKPGTSAEPVCNTDLLPTFCELAGVKPPADRALDGASLVPLLGGKPIVRPQPLYWQYDRAISRPWTLALRDGPWKLLADTKQEKFALFNVVEDVGESKDLAAAQPERVKSLAAALRKLHASINADGAKSGNPYPPAPAPKKK